MKVVILQPNYIPWIGYFEIIKSSDIFIFLDDVQYTKRDWRNRNFININNKKYLLTIPVNTKGKFHQKINEVKLANQKFKEKHLEIIRQNYKKTRYFDEFFYILNKTYNKYSEDYLSEFNINLIKVISNYLKIETKFMKSSDFKIELKSNEKLIELCKKVNCKIYLSGIKARNYLNEKKFIEANIKLKIVKYKQQKIYKNQINKFIPKLSIIDLIFNEGPNSINYLQDLELISYQQALKIDQNDI